MLEAIKNIFSRKKPATSDDSVFNLLSPREQEFADTFFPQTPISALEVNDISLEVLSLITEAADHLGVDLFNSNLFQYYQSAVHGEVLPEGLDSDELELMKEWTSATVLPDRFCVELLEFFDRADGVKERIERLSQYRFERLRTWSNCHVH